MSEEPIRLISQRDLTSGILRLRRRRWLFWIVLAIGFVGVVESRFFLSGGPAMASRAEHRVVRLVVESLSSLRPILLHRLRLEPPLETALPKLWFEIAWRV